MVNRRNTIVFEGFYMQQKVSYRQEVLKRIDKFEYCQIRDIQLNYDEQLSMLYMHKGALVLVCVAQRTDIAEMKTYLDNVNNMVMD